MFYSELVSKAANIMFIAHSMDRDKGGYPYVFHPFFLACQMDDEDSVCVALLHDVVEDHGDVYTFEMLEDEGFNSRIIDALRLLTHDISVPYMDYVKRLSSDQLARRIKIADLKHNMDIRRNGGVKTSKYELYSEALEYLEKMDYEVRGLKHAPRAKVPTA